MQSPRSLGAGGTWQPGLWACHESVPVPATWGAGGLLAATHSSCLREFQSGNQSSEALWDSKTPGFGRMGNQAQHPRLSAGILERRPVTVYQGGGVSITDLQQTSGGGEGQPICQVRKPRPTWRAMLPWPGAPSSSCLCSLSPPGSHRVPCPER